MEDVSSSHIVTANSDISSSHICEEFSVCVESYNALGMVGATMAVTEI